MVGSTTFGSMASVALAASAFFSVASGHLFMSSPSPIQGSAPKDPLDASGSNFPCHGVSLPSSGGAAWAAGSSQELAFDLGSGANTAVHGGGSCQISLTYETDPAKVKDPANWHVIYSIEGGCPSNTHQNLDGQYTGPQGSYSGAIACSDPRSNGVDCVNSFNFTIPEGVKNGNAIMAWTWFNSVGNREMYMNCANVDISGGTGAEMDSLPSMFVANLASVNTCPTTQSMDLAFPNAGKYVTTKTCAGEAAKTAVTFSLATPTGAGCGGGSAATPTGYGSGPGSASPAPSSSAYAAPTSSASASLDASGLPPAYQTTQPAQSNTNDQPAATATTMMTVTASSPASYAPPSAAASAAAPSAAAPSGYSGGSSASSNASDSSSSSSDSVSCTNDGAVVCIGSTQFGLCNAGTAVPQPLAPGTSCSNGVISKRRVVRHAARHISGRRHSHHY